MSFLVRKIDRPKWDNFQAIEPSRFIKFIRKFGLIKSEVDFDIQSDAITKCLKTEGNTLSVWEIENKTELEDAILALITGPLQEKLSTIHIVIIERDILLKNNLTLTISDGKTAFNPMVQKHIDISNLTYRKLGNIKNIIISCLDTQYFSTISKATLKEILKKAIDEGRLDKNSLNKKLLEKEKL